MFARLFATAAIALFALSANAAEPKATITDAFAYPTAGKIGIAYFTVTTTTDDAITAVASQCCDAVELHRSEKINGIMSMRRIATLSLKKNKPMQIQPDSKGGEHLMLIGLKQPLNVGDDVVVTVTFDKAGTQKLVLPVKARQAAATPEKNTGASEHHHE
jgi:copper(I)-binding protein